MMYVDCDSTLMGDPAVTTKCIACDEILWWHRGYPGTGAVRVYSHAGAQRDYDHRPKPEPEATEEVTPTGLAPSPLRPLRESDLPG